MPISLRVSLLERETTFSFFKREMFPSPGAPLKPSAVTGVYLLQEFITTFPEGVFWTPSIPAGYTQCSKLFESQSCVFCLRNAIGDLEDQIQDVLEFRHIPEVVGMWLWYYET